MPPQFATLISFLFIIYLFLIDRKKIVEGVSRAVYIPFFWMLLAGSRSVSQWLNLGAPIGFTTTDVYLEGNPVDRVVFLFLIVIGVWILYRRHLNLRILLHKNIWIILYFLFGATSIIWSEYPFVSFKRWIKALGNVIMALIILTEQRPSEAIGVILRRLAFLFLPLSVLFIKYYPNLGSLYHVTGAHLYIGVTTDKNSLGQLCIITGVYFIWHLLVNTHKEIGSERRLHFSIYLSLIPMICWILYIANSATSMVCLILSICILLVSRIPGMARKPTRIFVFGLVAISVFLVLEATLGLSELIIVNILGRDITLTTRVPMWYSLIKMSKNPVVGVGYESFWLGKRIELLWNIFGFPLHQAHNGYLEVYLNLGIIGLSLIVAIIISGLLKIQKQLNVDYPFAILRLTFLVVVALLSWTEAVFYGVNNMWLLLFLSVLDMSGQQQEFKEQTKETNTQSNDANFGGI